jgi:hypothetical protein
MTDQGLPGYHFGPEAVFNDKLAAALSLGEEQAEKAKMAVEQVVRGHRTQIQDAMRLEEAGAASGRERFHEAMGRLAALYEDASKALAGILTPEQNDRLHRISLQSSWMKGLIYPAVQNQLKLSHDQKKQIEKIGEELINDFEGVVRDGFRQANGSLNEATRLTEQKILSLHQSAVNKATELLSDEQREKWSDLMGLRS